MQTFVLIVKNCDTLQIFAEKEGKLRMPSLFINNAGAKTHYMVTDLMSIILKNFFSSTVPSMALELVDCYIRNYMSDSVFFSDNKKITGS